MNSPPCARPSATTAAIITAEKVVQEFWDYDDADREKARRLSDEYLKRRLQELKDGKRNIRTWKEN